MRFLRTVSTQRLLAIIAGLVIAIAGGTAIAVAAAGSGPVPPRESLAQALHQAAGAPAVTAISARISFTDNLIDSTALQGSDPLLSGATGRLWLSTATHQLRLELQGSERRRPDPGRQRRVLDLRPDVEHRLQGNAADRELAERQGLEPNRSRRWRRSSPS